MDTSDIIITGWDSIDMNDWPDLVDAYPTVAFYKSTKIFLDDGELEELANEHEYFCYSELLEWLA